MPATASPPSETVKYDVIVLFQSTPQTLPLPRTTPITQRHAPTAKHTVAGAAFPWTNSIIPMTINRAADVKQMTPMYLIRAIIAAPVWSI